MNIYIIVIPFKKKLLQINTEDNINAYLYTFFKTKSVDEYLHSIIYLTIIFDQISSFKHDTSRGASIRSNE